MRRPALAVLVAGVVCIALAYATAWSGGGQPAWGVWLMITGAALLLSGMLALSAQRAGVSARRATMVACLLFAVLLLGFGLPMVLSPESAAGPLFLGLPIRAAIEVYGVGLLPACFLPFVFAAEFRDEGLDQGSLDRLREQCAELRARSRPGMP
jgi:hypothetical protein